MSDLLEIQNDGPTIVSTNYWSSQMAKRGLAYLSWNAGCGRLLLPPALAGEIGEMRTGRECIVSRGYWQRANGQALELMFDDGSDSPYCLHLTLDGQTDRNLPADNQGGGFEIVAYVAGKPVQTWPGRYRIVTSLPCLEPWSTQ